MAKRKKHHQGPKNPDGGASNRAGGSWLYGVHACLAALANPQRNVVRIVVATQNSDDIEPAVVEAANMCEFQGGEPRPQVEFRDRREMDALLPRDAVHQGICIDASALPTPYIEDIIAEADGLSSACVVVLDQATDPRNIGAVMRTAAAFGALAVIVQDKHAPEITGAMAKAASGAAERVPFVRVTNLARTLDQLKSAEFWCVGFDGHTDKTLDHTTLKGRNAIVLGAEGAGMRRLTRETCDLLVKIPISDQVESLNLSNAAAIALYQFAQSNS